MGYSFDIKSSKDLYDEFKRRIGEYRDDPLSSGKAVICAILAWSVVEWMYNEYFESSIKFPKLKNFQSSIKKECPSLSFMQDIANGSKHRGISHYTSAIKNTEVHKGGFSESFSKGFDVNSLGLELDTGEYAFFDEEVNQVESFLKEYIANL